MEASYAVSSPRESPGRRIMYLVLPGIERRSALMIEDLVRELPNI